MQDVKAQLASLTEATAAAVEALLAGNTALVAEKEELVRAFFGWCWRRCWLFVVSIQTLIPKKGGERKAYHASQTAETIKCWSSMED